MNFSPYTEIPILSRKFIPKFRQNKRQGIPNHHFSRVVTNFKVYGSILTSNKRVSLSGVKIEDFLL